MKLRKIIVLLLSISFVFLTEAGARSFQRQRRRQQKPVSRKAAYKNIVEFDLLYDLSIPKKTRTVSLVVVLPRSIRDRQKIRRIKYSPEPTRIFSKNGNNYAAFVLTKPERRTEIKISVKAELYRYDLFTAMEKRRNIFAENPQYTEFLKQEKKIEKDHSQIQQIAESIEGRRETDIVRNIYDYVIENMKYVIQRGSDWGAIKALREGKGDCSEYADLFVALCRAKNIPARVVTGYTVRIDTATSKHHWAEVYLQDYGWVPFDPTFGDVRSDFLRDRTFDTLSPAYIYLSHVRNDDVLDNYNFYKYSYYGDRVRLKDSIKFTQID